MTTRTKSDELLRLMLERRADVPPPAWLLPSVTQVVRATPQARPGWRRAWWLPRRRSERLVLGAASAMLVLAVVLGAMVAGGMVNRSGKPPLSGTVVEPSPSASGSSDVPSESPSRTTRPSDPGSPTSPDGVVVAAWSLPTGWRYVVDCGQDSPCVLHLYDAAGREQEGWPVAISGNCEASHVAVGRDDSAFVACTRESRAVVYGLDRSGNALPGWPVSLRGQAAQSTWNDFNYAFGWPSIAVGPDATVFVAAAPKGDGSYAIHALAPDGKERDGWPVALKGDAQGFAVGADGGIVAWWYESSVQEMQFDARRTVFTEIGPNGQVLKGWPKESVGAASGPVVLGDGSIVYTSATGKVWAHDRGAAIIDGWPYSLAYPVAPSLRADGKLMFIEDSRVVVLDRHGKDVAGWPYRSKGSFMGSSCDTGGYPSTLAAVAEDGTLYLAPWVGTRSSVVALDADGGTVDGWPYKLAAGWRVGELSLSPDGSIEAYVGPGACLDGFEATHIRLTPQGVLLGDELPTPLSEVYEAMRLDGLRTSSGKDTFVQGARIDFEVELVNRSSHDIVLPHVGYADGSWYAAGSVQTWIEPLDPPNSYPGPPLPCLSNAGRGNDWYATGGEITVSRDPLTISPGGAMPMKVALTPQFTGCFTPGEYRYRIEYKRLDAEPDEIEAIDDTTLVFTITPRAPVVTPSPSPPPKPTPQPQPLPTPPSPTPPPVGPTTPSPS